MSFNMIDAAWSPDGKWIAISFANDYDGGIHLLDPHSFQIIKTIKLADTGVNQITFLPDSLHLLGSLSRPDDYWVQEWNVLSGQMTNGYKDAEISNHDWVLSVSAAQGDRVFAAIPNVGGRIWDRKTGAVLQRFPRGDFGDMSADGRYVITDVVEGGAHGDAWVYDAATGKRLHRFKTSGYPSVRVGLSPNGKKAFVIQQDVWIYDTENGQEISHFVEDDYPYAAVFSRDGRYLLCANAAGTVSLWDTEQIGRMSSFKINAGEIAKAVYSPDEKQFAAVSLSGIVALWSTETGKELHRLQL